MRHINTTMPDLKAVLTHAWAWGVWVSKMQTDAVLLYDLDAATRLGYLRDGIMGDIRRVALAAGLEMPDEIPDIENEDDMAALEPPFSR